MGGRRGRKRKEGQRHPGGQLVKPQQDLKTRTSRQPHRRGLPPGLRTDERAESPLGRLFLQRLAERERHPAAPQDPATTIDADCYDAGSRYAVAVGEYRATIGAPRTTSGSGRGFDCLAEVLGRNACRFDPDGCACLKRKAVYEQAFEALAAEGRAALMAVNRVVIQREEPGQDLVYLVRGLRALARHFGLTRGPRRHHYENAN